VSAWPAQPDSRTCGPSVVVVAQQLPHALPDPWPQFETRVRATHRRINGWWPRALGTPPWAVARELGGRVRWIRGRGWSEVLAALPHPTPVYLGSRWLPRHVVLALGAQDGVPLVYDPAGGAVVPVTTSRWGTAWFAVVPRREC
jgi:hypothetical protein